MRYAFPAFFVLFVSLTLHRAGCSKPPGGAPADDAVVIYCSVDREFAEPILADFEKRHGVTVHRQYDTEAGKTTGLVNKIIAERAAPRADVWWSSEIFGTIQLANEGLLAPYRPNHTEDIPSQFRDPNERWTAFGLRGRVIAYDPKRVDPADVPRNWADLTQAKYKGRVALADPRFGTTRGHMAAMYQLWGREALSSFCRALRANDIRRADGNAHAVLLLSRGVVDFACTDTDDVIVALDRGDSIAMCYPDMDAPGSATAAPGTLWIPCSVALIKGGRGGPIAKKLIDEIASAQTERLLAQSSSRNVPVRAALRDALRAEGILLAVPNNAPADGGANTTHPALPAAAIDYGAAAARLADSDALVGELLLH